MKSEFISKENARQFLINYHNFNGSQKYVGYEGVMEYFAKVRSVQYDPLNVVGRNADLVLQSKIKNYKPEMLQKLLYQERRLIDGFDKEMCIYIAEDYSKFERVRREAEASTINTLTYRNQMEIFTILDEVRDYILKNGAISSKDISIGQSRESRWGHKKLSSAALDYLYTIGELCVVNKNGTQKVYDFTDKVYPSYIHKLDNFHNDEEFYLWYVKRRIGSVGIVWDKTGPAWQGHFLSNKKKREEALYRLCEEGELLELHVEDIKAPFYILKADEHYFENSNEHKQVKFLAPLDNAIWDRNMVSQLFDFEYSWEVYVPATKRKYGYYVLPVLYGDKLIARFEPEQAKKNQPFEIKNWWWEPGTIITTELMEAIQVAIDDFCRYLEVEAENDYSSVFLNS